MGGGCRYELLDGTILMTPAPGPRHQALVSQIWRALDDVLPAGLRVLELRRGEYVEVESSVHGTTWATSVPFEVALDLG